MLRKYNIMKYYLIISVCIILLYVYCYFIYPSHLSIIQTSLNEFDFTMLFKKQPLVIEDKSKEVLTILNSWFTPNIVHDIEYDNKRTWNVNSHKYLYVYALEDCEILLYPPKHKVVDDTPNSDEPVIAINLRKLQSLVIPYCWYYNIKNKYDAKLYGIHDYVTYMLDIFI